MRTAQKYPPGNKHPATLQGVQLSTKLRAFTWTWVFWFCDWIFCLQPKKVEANGFTEKAPGW